MHIALVAPEIPQNTGNIARTCAALGATLHLVHPLGFSVAERAVRRAGLDYWRLVDVHEHRSFDHLVAELAQLHFYFFSSHGQIAYSDVEYGDDSVLVFGCESRGLPQNILDRRIGAVVRIPTIAEARSLNLSNAVAIAAYEVARQSDYENLSKHATDSRLRSSQVREDR